MKFDKIIDYLNIILEIEHGAVLQYILHTYRLTRSGNKELAGELLVIANDEIRHAEALEDKIRELGGKPTTSAKWPKSKGDLEEMLQYNLESEKKSIVLYEKLINIAKKEKFEGLKVLLREQLTDEIEHCRTLKKFLDK